MTFNARIVLLLGPIVILGIVLMYDGFTLPGDQTALCVIGGFLVGSFTPYLVRYWNVKYPQ